MKKNDFIYPAIFLVIVLTLFVIPIGAFLTAEIVGFEAVRSAGDWIYVFLKDQGSLIAGLIALLAVFITLKAQKRREIKQAMELERQNSLELLIQLEGLGRKCSSFSLDFNPKCEDILLASRMRERLKRANQKTLEIGFYLQKKELSKDLCRLLIIMKLINLSSEYLNHFIGLTKHPEWINEKTWRWRVQNLNDEKRKILGELDSIGFELESYHDFCRDFNLRAPSADTAILRNMWFFVSSKVLKDLIHSVRCIDEISDD